MDAKFKRNDDVLLIADRGKDSRPRYKVHEYFLGSVPHELRVHKGWNVRSEIEDESDHNYLIVPVDGGAEQMVNENELEPA